MEKQAILVYLETVDGQIVKVSLEALNAACKLAAQTGKTVTAVLVGDGSAADSAAAYGAAQVVHVAAGEYQAETYTEILTALCQRCDASLPAAGFHPGRQGAGCPCGNAHRRGLHHRCHGTHR